MNLPAQRWRFPHQYQPRHPVVTKDGRKPTVTYTPPVEPTGISGAISKLWFGNGNAKTKSQACNSKCDELKQLLMRAYVADDVYGDRDGGEVMGSPNYERLSRGQLVALGIDPSQLINKQSGFYSAL